MVTKHAIANLIETPSVLGALQGFEFAISEGAIVTLIGDSGSGKSVILRYFADSRHWPTQIQRVLAAVDFRTKINVGAATDLFGAAGVFSDPPTEEERAWVKDEYMEEFERSMKATKEGKYRLERMPDEVFDSHVRHHQLPRERVYEMGQAWLTAKGRRIEVKLPLLLELGLITRDVPPLPIYIRNREAMSKAFFIAELARRISPGIPPGLSYRRIQLIDEAFRLLPFVLLFDEADRARNSVLHFLREINEEHGTPIVLAGTPALSARLSTDRDLMPLLTRIKAQGKIEPLTLEELQVPLLEFSPAVVKRIWARSGANFRTASFLVAYLKREIASNPRLRVTEDLIDEFASVIPGARHVHAPAPVEREALFVKDLAETGAVPPTRAASGRLRKRATS